MMNDEPGHVSLEHLPLHSTTLLTVLDRDGVIRYESPSIERVFGFDQDALVGEPVAEYFHPTDREDVVEAFQSVVTAEEYRVESIEFRHRQADGSYCWVESVASQDPTPDGRYVVSTRDISAQKQRERELEATIDRLDAFADVLSHDLRGPLSVARSRLELAQRECDSDHLIEVERAHERMETLVEDLLTVARSGDGALQPESIDLAAMCEQCWRTVQTGEATLVTHVEGTLVADRSRLSQLIENLVRNAIEHGSDDATIRVGALSEGSGFYLADDGPGIPEENRQRVFESGYSTGDSGTGLGLTIVKEIASEHGWEVVLEQSSDGGARFEITGISWEEGINQQ